MRNRKRTQAKINIKRGPVLMALAALWLGYRALTSPGDLAHLARFVPDSPSTARTGKPADPVDQLLKQTAVLQGKIDEEHAALEDLGNPDGVSRLPAGHTPSVAFEKLTPHCPALKRLKSNAWIEIDESGQVLSIEAESKGPPVPLGDCQFEPYRDPNGRPLSVRSHYTVAK